MGYAQDGATWITSGSAEKLGGDLVDQGRRGASLISPSFSLFFPLSNAVYSPCFNPFFLLLNFHFPLHLSPLRGTGQKAGSFGRGRW